LFGLLKLIFSD